MKLGTKPIGIIIGLLLIALLWYMEMLPYLGPPRPAGPPPPGVELPPQAIFGKLFSELPPWVNVWMKFQDMIIASCLIFVLFKKEAQIYALGILANHAFLFPILPLIPAAKVSLGFAALSHFFWIIPLVVLIRAWPKTDKNTAFGVWMTIAIAQLSFSLFFDIPQGFQFLGSLFT